MQSIVNITHEKYSTLYIFVLTFSFYFSFKNIIKITYYVASCGSLCIYNLRIYNKIQIL